MHRSSGAFQKMKHRNINIQTDDLNCFSPPCAMLLLATITAITNVCDVAQNIWKSTEKNGGAGCMTCSPNNCVRGALAPPAPPVPAPTRYTVHSLYKCVKLRIIAYLLPWTFSGFTGLQVTLGSCICRTYATLLCVRHYRTLRTMRRSPFLFRFVRVCIDFIFSILFCTDWHFCRIKMVITTFLYPRGE